MSGSTYDPKKLVITYGIIPINGFADGDAISIEKTGPGVTTKVGVAGEYAFQDSADESGTITVRLMETAAINLALVAHYQAGNIPKPITFANLSTGRIVLSAAAKIQRIPNSTHGAEVGVLEWVFVCGEINSVS